MPLEILEVNFDCAGFAEPQRVLVATALWFWRRAHFRTSWSLFVAGAREISWFGGPKSTFRDRCKGSERLTSKCRFCGRRSTLDMVVIFNALYFRDRWSEV